MLERHVIIYIEIDILLNLYGSFVGSIAQMIDAVASKIPLSALAIHCHNTYGQALANIYQALQVE